MDTKSKIIAASVLLIFVILVIVSRVAQNGGSKDILAVCIDPNLPLTRHWHPKLAITVDGQAEAIPGGIGLSDACHRPLHTHETDGVIHLEAQDDTPYTLLDFFRVWGKPIEREGYSAAISVGGNLVPDASFVLQDGQEIRIEYSVQK